VAAPRNEQSRRLVGGQGLLLGRPFGVPIFVSPSWLFFLVFITLWFAPVVDNAVPGIGSARFAVAAAFGVFLGLSVLAHEVAHCAVARRLSIPIERISLSFLAGHSALAQEPQTPGKSALISAAGPLSNLVIAVLSGVAFHFLPEGGIGSILTAGLTWSNALVGVFNLLPGLPLDGGQLLRAAIWRLRGNPRSGTIGAAWAGRVVAVATALASVVLMPSHSTDSQISAFWGLLVAGTLWVSSTSVLRQQAARDRLPGLSARALSRSAICVSADLPLAEAVRRAQQAYARGIVIVDDDGRPTAVAKEVAVNAVPVARRPWVTVGSVARAVSTEELIDVELTGEPLLAELRAASAAEFVVVNLDGSVYGVLAGADVVRALSGRVVDHRRTPAGTAR
jgi:Zn-dependent protease